MRNIFADEKIEVRMSESCGPYIMIEPTRLDDVMEFLRANGIPFTLEDGSHSCLGTPEAAVIEFGKAADVSRIQQVLDSVR